MLNKVKEIVIVVNKDNRYKLYNRDLGCYISGYDDYNTAVDHANKENNRMNKYRIVKRKHWWELIKQS